MITDAKTALVCSLKEQDINDAAIDCGVYRDIELARSWLTINSDKEYMRSTFYSDYLPVAIVYDSADEFLIKSRVFTSKMRSKLIKRINTEKSMEERLQDILNQPTNFAA
jgi:hypothetical protein